MSPFKSPDEMLISELTTVGLWENPSVPAYRMLPYLKKISKLKLNGYLDDPRAHNSWVIKNKLNDKMVRININNLDDKFKSDYDDLNFKLPICPVYEYDFFLLSNNFDILSNIKIQKTSYVFWTNTLQTLETEMKKHNMYAYINRIGDLLFINNVLYKDNAK